MPGLLPGEFHGQRSLAGYRSQTRLSDRAHTHTQENTLMRGLHDFFFSPTFAVADKRQCVSYKGEISAQDTTRTETG